MAWAFSSSQRNYLCANILLEYTVFFMGINCSSTFFLFFQGIVGNLASGKSALVHRYLTGTYVQEESPEGMWICKFLYFSPQTTSSLIFNHAIKQIVKESYLFFSVFMDSFSLTFSRLR